MWKALKRAGQGLFDLIYPNVCLACLENSTTRTGSYFCTDCHSKIPYTDHFDFPKNDLMYHFYGKARIEKAAACFYFFEDGVMQKIIHNLKYKNFPEIGTQLGNMAGDLIFKHNFHLGIDVIIPVPLHHKKQHLRGYNQAALIAEGISEEIKIPVLKNVLIKNVENQSQTFKTRMQRMENTVNVYSIRNRNKVVNKHVLLIDDVVTTGATIISCAEVLNEAGADKVSVVCIATAARGY